jgi:hypothetical protein
MNVVLVLLFIIVFESEITDQPPMRKASSRLRCDRTACQGGQKSVGTQFVEIALVTSPSFLSRETDASLIVGSICGPRQAQSRCA